MLRLGDNDMTTGRQSQFIGAGEGLQKFLHIGDEVLFAVIAELRHGVACGWRAGGDAPSARISSASIMRQ